MKTDVAQFGFIKTHKYYSLKVFLIIIIERCSPRLLLVKSNKSFLKRIRKPFHVDINMK